MLGAAKARSYNSVAGWKSGMSRGRLIPAWCARRTCMMAKRGKNWLGSKSGSWTNRLINTAHEACISVSCFITKTTGTPPGKKTRSHLGSTPRASRSRSALGLSLTKSTIQQDSDTYDHEQYDADSHDEDGMDTSIPQPAILRERCRT